MRVAQTGTVLSLIGICALAFAVAGCPEKSGAPAGVEPERAEPDESEDKAKTPAAAPAPAAEDEKKEEKEEKEEGGW